GLGVLDFGSIKRFSPTFIDVHRKLFRDAIDGRERDDLAICRAVGFSIELPDEQARPLIHDLLHIAGRPLRVDEYDYATCQISRDAKKLVRENAAAFLKIRPPAEAVMFFRSTGGLSQNLRLIGGRG